MKKKIKTNWKKVRSNGKIGILRPAINVWRPNYKKGLPFLRFKLTTFHSRLANLSIQLLNFLYKCDTFKLLAENREFNDVMEVVIL